MYWLPPSAVKQSGKTTIAGAIFSWWMRRAARSGTFSPKPFQSGVARAAAHEADQVEEDREAARGERLRVVLRRQPDVNRPHERIAEGIALQHLRRVREDGRGGRVSSKVFGRHGRSRMLRNDSLGAG